MLVMNNSLWYIQRNWHFQNKKQERYLFSNKFFWQTCLYNLPLKWFSKFFCINKSTKVYVCMNICGRISTRTVIDLLYIFHSFLNSPNSCSDYIYLEKPLLIRCNQTWKAAFYFQKLKVNSFVIIILFLLLILLTLGSGTV